MEERIVKLLENLICSGQITEYKDLKEANEIYYILKSKVKSKEGEKTEIEVKIKSNMDEEIKKAKELKELLEEVHKLIQSLGNTVINNYKN